MKHLTATIFVLLSQALAAQPGISEPEAIVSLRESWLKAKRQATDPLDRKYAEALKTLKSRYTKDGNLEAALAADAELKKIEAGGALLTASTTTQSGATTKLPEPGVLWTAIDDADVAEIEFKDNGTMLVQRRNGKIFGAWRWHTTENQEVVITTSSAPPTVVTLNSDKKGYWVGKWPDGTEFKLKAKTP